MAIRMRRVRVGLLWLGVVRVWAAQQPLRRTRAWLSSWWWTAVFASECVHVRSSLLIDLLRNPSRTGPTPWLHGTLLPSTGYASPSLRFVVFWACSKVSVTVATIAANGSLGGLANACFGGEVA